MKKVVLLLSLCTVLASTLMVSCKSPFSSKPIHIGDTCNGGIVFYLDSTEQHGLVAAMEDQSTTIAWDPQHENDPNRWSSYTAKNTDAIKTDIGSGSENTTKIIATFGNGKGYNRYAASICRDYRGGDFKDWYLPSRDELYELYVNRALVGGFDDKGTYLSSSEVYDDKPAPVGSKFERNYYSDDIRRKENRYVWCQSFYNGQQGFTPKYNSTVYGGYGNRCVRAVRSF